MTYADAINGVTQGRRHQAMLCIASACRGWGHSKAKASEAVTLAAARCTPPYPVAEALDLVGWCYAHLPAGALPPAPHGIPTVLWIAYQHARVNAHPDGSQRYRLFVSMARDLQRLRAAEPIVLPQPLLAQILGCSHQAISRMIHRALDDDSLLVIADSNYRPGALAKRYRYVGEIG